MNKKQIAEYHYQRDEILHCLSIKFVRFRAGFLPGVECVLATIPSMGFPIGTVWYQQYDNETIFIMTSYVEPWARRLGVRTAINKAIIDGYDLKRIVTGRPISEESRLFMESQGYVQQKSRWVLNIKRGRKK